MISKLQIKKVNNFIGNFIEVFGFYTKPEVNKVNSDKTAVIGPGGLALRVSGAIDGYLIIVPGKSPPTGKHEYGHLKPGSSEKLINCYKQRMSVSGMSPEFRIDVMDKECIDEFLYHVRKSEPEMAVRIKTGNYSIELYAFSVSD